MAPCTAAEPATSAWGVMAPTVTMSPTVMPLRPSMPARSTTSVGAASRCFRVGMSVMPPARNTPSSAPERNSAAWARLDALW